MSRRPNRCKDCWIGWWKTDGYGNVVKSCADKCNWPDVKAERKKHKADIENWFKKEISEVGDVNASK